MIPIVHLIQAPASVAYAESQSKLLPDEDLESKIPSLEPRVSYENFLEAMFFYCFTGDETDLSLIGLPDS